jgi:FtsP/CotA-like multicopper oxidase with cupredoxin domain
MNHQRLVIYLGLAVAVLVWGLDLGYAQSQQAGLKQSSISQLGIDQTPLQEAQAPDSQSEVDPIAYQETQKSAAQRRHEAYARLQAIQEGQSPEDIPIEPPAPRPEPPAPGTKALPLPTGQNPLVDLDLANWSTSPNIRKFIDTLPGLGAPLPGSLLGTYIPVATADSASYPGSDYYEIGLVCYSQKMNSDLPATDLRGYVEIETAANAGVSKHIALTYPNGSPILDNNGVQVLAVDPPSYLGPVILSAKGRPVRVKFTNYLPLGAAGDLPMPVDTGVMGAGMGPVAMQNYTQNRATLHLHGGRTPWISDGTPHQWTTPAGEVTSYPKGASVQNVPDMPDPGPGSITFYWTNEQSGRLMFYHDHAYGITRLNVYAGEAAGYLVTDQVEEDLISGTNVSGGNPTNAAILPNPLGGLYRYGIPLVIQDKSFVCDATTPPGAGFPAGAVATPLTQATDPLWYTYVPNTHGGNLWWPHEYPINENIYDPSGITMKGRWDYGPFMNPPMVVKNDVLPSPTITPESFMDTVIVNGCAYPYIELPPTAFRFRILNACNDRMLNLQLYKAEPLHVSVINGGGAINGFTDYSATPTVTITGGGGTYTSASATVVNGAIYQIDVVGAAGYTSSPTVTITDATGTGAVAYASPNTEVKMVPAAPNPWYPTWPKDGRDGGVPDPTTQGPPMIQIGNEGGFLADVNVVYPQPVDFDYNRKNATFGAVTSVSLHLPPAVRADVIVDFSAYKDGDTLILYNDCPAPQPLYDTRYDFFTDNPDQVIYGGAPTTIAGFGPNTRTVMQIRIKGSATAPFDLATLQTVLPQAFKVAQDAPIVPESCFNKAYGTSYPDIFADVTTETLNVTGAPQPVAAVMTVLPGLGYTTPPTVTLVSSTGSGATASAGLNPFGGVTLVTAGSGYTSPPAVTIGPPILPLTVLPLAPGGLVQGIQARAVATISGGVVTAITITEPGAGYTDIVTAPAVTIAAPAAGGVAATATGMLPTLGTVGSIVVTGGGSGYLTAPLAILRGGGGLGAQADATLVGSMAPTGKAITEGFDPDYGRMFVQLGSIPNVFTPNVGAGPVIGMSMYIDPPTEVLTPETPVLWRISHIGVDSHALHFHLFDVQVINRVDWANIKKPPYPDEVGWKDTIRTNPFEDIIVAFRPTAAAMRLPFGLPDSNRLLDVTTPAGSTANFLPVAAPIGVPVVAQVTNVMTNFAWEYVFHCHLLGHEENDMMRPVVFQVPSTTPSRPTLTATSFAVSPAATAVQLAWSDGTPYNYVSGLPVSTEGNPANEVGFRIEKAIGAGAYAPLQTAPANTTRLMDSNVVVGTSYRYRITAFNAAGNSANRTATVTVAAPTAPAAPTNLVATGALGSIGLTWQDHANNESGFVLERSDNGAAFAQIAAVGPRTGTGSVTYTDSTAVVVGTSYVYQVKAVNGVLSSAYAVSNTVVVPSPPAAPSNLTATASLLTGSTTQDRVRLAWTVNSTNQTGFQIQRATDSGFTTNLYTRQLSATATSWTNSPLPRGATYWYRICAFNTGGYSAYAIVGPVTTP